MEENQFPQDILLKIDELFKDGADKAEALALAHDLFQGDWGVGTDQLARSLLVLSEGQLSELKKWMTDMEPRDIIMAAEVKAGNPGHYFLLPFDS